MNQLDLIKKRKSIRSFNSDIVSEDDIKTLLEAARWAPSAGNRQPFNRYWTISNAISLGSPTVAPLISLNFGSEVNTWSLTDYGGNNNSLFQNYYQNYITRVFDSRNRLFKFKVKLPLEFLLNFSLADTIKIGNREFTINKVTADLTTGESTMELLNIF